MAKVFRYDDVPVVETKSGKLQGYFFNKTYIFKGIPYAKAKRFQMPADVEPWEDVREAASYGMVCPMLTQDRPSGELKVSHRYWPFDENCQNLNVWTKSLDKAEKRPVLVWFHGGGFSAGSAIEQVAYDGANMCDYGDVVVVTVNHRLNILGYLDLSPFGEKYKNSANAGHADLVASLKWVRENISAFGGDPDNVTIFGQSGGGMKCTGLMQIPAADGLFHKAVIMSGVSDGKLLTQSPGDGRAIVEAVLNELKFPDAEMLESVPYYELANAYNKVRPQIAAEGKYVGCGPLKNDYYHGEPLMEGFTEHAKKIPMMIGSVFGEFAFGKFPYNKLGMSEQEMEAEINKICGDDSAKLISLFKAAYPGKKIMDVCVLDRVFRIPSKKLAMLAAKESSAPAYLYNFTLEFPYQNGKIAWHCSDIPFFFHNTELVEVCNIPNVSDKLESQMFDSIINFAKNGNPNNAGLPEWPNVKPGDEATMIFDRECEVRHNYDDELLEFHGEVSKKVDFAAISRGEFQH